MSSDTTTETELTAEEWDRLLAAVDGPATFGTVARALEDARDLPGREAPAAVEAALEADVLAEHEPDRGQYPVLRLVDEAPSTGEAREPTEPDAEPAATTDGGADRALEAGPAGATPTPGVDASGSSPGAGANPALADALEWYHQQLDRELPEECDHDTPREYYRGGRGWDAETIDEKLLGYAPPNHRDELVTHLFQQGHAREAILATGLFGEDLRPLWHGRYVLPYFGAEGRPVYAISRETAPKHPEDFIAGKYGKLAHTKEYADVEEPIYGLETVEAGEPVLITEGIADAITAHQAGYPCLSPVTTQFKTRDREDLLEALAERDVGRAYLVQDAERPTSDVDDRGRLTLQQVGEGVKGAVRTAAYLADHGLEARVAELPRPGLKKVDLDDYLRGWSDDLTPVLAAARPVEQHPAYDSTTAKNAALDAAETSDRSGRDDDQDGDATGDTNSSGLFDLSIRDVSGLPEGYRGTNPLGHHGESENYFVLLEDRGLAYDHKYKVAYNALTYLLVDAGERDADAPNGQLDAAEVFTAWSHAKEEGLIADDDPIPLEALQHVAREATEWDGELVEHDTASGDTFDGLPTDAYNAALEAVRDEHGLDPGRRPLGERAGDDAEHTAVLPEDEALDTATSGWDWRHAAERDDDALTVDEARERTREEIARAYQRGDDVLVEALPTMGKSYGAVAAAADTDTQVTVLTTRGRKEQYGQLREWAEEHGLSHYTLPSFTRDCLTAAGEHGDEWRETVLDWYRRGATPKEIHKSAEYVLGRPLPCQEHEGQRCPYASKWDFDPDDYDVLIGHYSHAYKAKVTAGRAVAVDEFPAAYETVFAGQLQPAVSRYLETTPELPFEDYTDLLEHRDDPERRAEALAFFDEEDALEPAEGDVLEDDHAHAAAPLATFTTLAAEDLGNGLERVEAPSGWVGVRNRRTDAVTILRPPEPLEYATAVVGLDGTPTPEMWNLAVGQRLDHRAVLDDDEKREYVDEALNLNLVRTTEYVKPYNSAEHVNAEADGALFEAIAEQHGQPPAVITSATAEGEYRQAGVDELVGETKHYGNVLGSNAFAEERVGAVVGSNHYGDDFIQKWGAYAGRTVERDPEAKGAELSYGRFGDKVLTHMREHDTLQAAMRFGRDGNGAVVYVHTDTLPEWVPLAGEGRVLTTWSDGMRAVVDALEELGSATTAELVEHTTVDLSRQQVFDHLETLRERGVLAREQDPEDGRRVVWQDDELHRLGEHGEVELSPVDFEDLTDAEVRQVARSSIYTWQFTNRGGSPGRDTAAAGEEPGSEAVAGGRGGGPAANGTD